MNRRDSGTPTSQREPESDESATTENYYEDSAFESAYSGIAAADAVALILQAEIAGGAGAGWSDLVVDALITGQRILLHHASTELDRLRRENVSASARLSALEADNGSFVSVPIRGHVAK